MRTPKVDVAVIGSGAMALWQAWALIRRGLRVAVVEAMSEIASGASVKNEGWLHRGTYHSAAIVDRLLAIQVARRTIDGHDITLRFAPEARTEFGTHTFALLRSGSLEETTSRWDDAGVFYRPVKMSDVVRLEPQLRLGDYEHVFEVADVAVNSRIIYRKLLDEIRPKGALIFTQAELVAYRDPIATFRVAGHEEIFETRAVVCAAGCGIRPLFASVFGADLPVRYFVSHLFDVPRVSRHAFFGIDPRDITAMHHGDWSVVGFTKDQVAVPEPSFEPQKEQVEQIVRALRLVAPHSDILRGTGRACTKVDVDYQVASANSFGNLNIAYGEPIPNVFWVLPGKMTEAPYAAQTLADVLRKRIDNVTVDEELAPESTAGFRVARRPIDTYQLPQCGSI